MQTEYFNIVTAV